MFSKEFRARRSISGTWYLYHNPVLPTSTSIRMSILKLRLGLFKQTARQCDWLRSSRAFYAGRLTLQKDFVYLELSGVAEQYRGNRSYIILFSNYGPYEPKKNTGTCGRLISIANDHSIFERSVLTTRLPIGHDDVARLLSTELSRDLGVLTRSSFPKFESYQAALSSLKDQV
jgi:hypothetical protein